MLVLGPTRDKLEVFVQYENLLIVVIAGCTKVVGPPNTLVCKIENDLYNTLEFS